MIGLAALHRARASLLTRAGQQRLLVGRYAALADLGVLALAAWPLKRHSFLRNAVLAVLGARGRRLLLNRPTKTTH